MQTGGKKKLTLGSKKSSHIKLDQPKIFRQLQQSRKHNKSTSTLIKHNVKNHQNSSASKTNKSKSKIDNCQSKIKNDQKTEKNMSRKRLFSSCSQKQNIFRSVKSSQKKQQKYIFNQIPNNKTRNSQTANERNQSLISHSKTYLNQNLFKHSFQPKSDVLSFAKSSNSELKKIKKKKHDYIKNFSKTSYFDKSLINGFTSTGYELNSTIGLKNFDRTGITSNQKMEQNLQKVTEQELQKIQIKNSQISQIRLYANNLFKKLKQPNKSKLLKITNGYQKIVSQLYSIIQKDSLPQCQLSRIHTKNSPKQNKQTYQNSTVISKAIQEVRASNSPIQRKTILESEYSSSRQSEHWDIYLDYGQQEIGSSVLIKHENEKQSLVKKLNIGGIKKSQIKPYQDEFMDMKQGFSESWKRQLNDQKRF